MKSGYLPDFERWRSANRSRRFSLFDYAHLSLRDRGVSADSVLALAQLVWPQFLEKDGLVLVAENYSAEKMAELRLRGMSDHDVEFWINLFCVDGFFHEMADASDEHIEEFAHLLAQSWTTKLKLDYPNSAFEMRIIRDDDAGDLCISFTQKRED